MNVVDSSGWLEYFADGPNAEFFASAIADAPDLVVPSISIYEVFKRVRQQREEGEALEAVAVMSRGIIVDLDAALALRAAQVSLHHRLPLADSVILAAAQAYEATLWTQDADFAEIPGVKYIEKCS